MEKLFTLIELQKTARSAASLGEFGHILVNQTQTLVPYKKALFWTNTPFGIDIISASGGQEVEANSPYSLWVKSFLKKGPVKDRHTQTQFSHTPETVEAPEKIKWEEHTLGHVHVILFQSEEEGLLGGLWLEDTKPLTDSDQKILEELTDSLSQTLALLKLRKTSHIFGFWKHLKRFQILLWIALIAAFFMPARLTITAPAEITPDNIKVVSAPFNGTLEEVLISPGDVVERGQDVARLKNEELTAQLQTAEQAVEIAAAALSRARRESLSTPEKRQEINALQAEIKARRIEYDYARRLIQKSTLQAPLAGLALFSDRTELIGKPVRTGQEIMRIASPEDSYLTVRVPVQAMIPVNPETAKIRFFLNVSPIQSYEAKLETIGYRASADPDGLMTYKIKASLSKELQKSLRVGWKGTAKIYGEKTILGYVILRRPLIALRKLLG